MALTDLGNTPISTLPGIERYSESVNGGVLHTTTIRSPDGETLGVGSAFAASGVSQTESVTAITTAGAGTLTAASLLSGVINRSGPTGNFTDTTDTAALIQAAWVGATNSSFEFSYINGTAFNATLAGGSGVTLAGNVVIPANCTGRFLVVWTSAGAVAITNLLISKNNVLNRTKYTSINVTTGSLAAGVITGADWCYVLSTNATPGAQLVRTAAQMLADSPNGAVGMSWSVRIANSGAGTLTLTTDAGATVTMSGTMTVPQNTFRDFTVTINTATTATVQTTGTGTWS